ncbi:hypothetical protein JS533_010980 [Bifidobacterium amazonense]|uniref:NADH:flavin oxidoreductase/NADH oxidase N-terminal domain-containing protein n=1 Tax=Bifidobacterium amazonense TaxID=2809027 RepID=A0ABS9VXF6_9BIFI|nr:hypothetical protein [Bifidobacterium amazonense]MCH9276790.1 hypothetical protein [Bifidobacterium amazonense]
MTLKNRFYKSAMNEALAGRDCAPTEAHVRLYREWAKGGTGVLVTGNVMVDHTQLGESARVGKARAPGDVVIGLRRGRRCARRSRSCPLR